MRGDVCLLWSPVSAHYYTTDISGHTFNTEVQCNVLRAFLHPKGMALPSRAVPGTGNKVMVIFALEELNPVKKLELD